MKHADVLSAGWRKARQEVSFGGAKQQLAVGGSLRLRLSHAKMALAHMLALGGFAYLPVPLVADYLDEASLHLVEDTPLIQRHVYAVYPLRSAKRPLIRSCLRLVSAEVPFTLEETGFS